MRCKSFDVISVTLMLLALDWGSIGNFNSTRTLVAAASCQTYVGQISEIRDGSVQRKQLNKKEWEKIVNKTKLCYGDILKTTSNKEKKIVVKVKCTDSDEVEKRVDPDQIIGVNNICLHSALLLKEDDKQIIKEITDDDDKEVIITDDGIIIKAGRRVDHNRVRNKGRIRRRLREEAGTIKEEAGIIMIKEEAGTIKEEAGIIMIKEEAGTNR